MVFTGGEATIEWDSLLAGIRHAHRKGLPTRLVTNGHWATSTAEAGRCAGLISDSGLTEINFSSGDEHLKFIDQDTLVRAIVAALECGIRTTLVFERREQPKVPLSAILLAIRRDADPAALEKLFDFRESPWMPTHPTKRSSVAAEDLTNAGNLASRSGCDSVLQTYVLQGDGRIGACCGLGMRGIRELQVGRSSDADFLQNSIHKAEADWIKVALRVKGPEKILAWAASIDPKIEWENMYAHRCQACIRMYRDPVVRQVVRENIHRILPDLIVSAYLDESLAERINSISPTAR